MTTASPQARQQIETECVLYKGVWHFAGVDEEWTVEIDRSGALTFVSLEDDGSELDLDAAVAGRVVHIGPPCDEEARLYAELDYLHARRELIGAPPPHLDYTRHVRDDFISLRWEIMALRKLLNDDEPA